MFVTVAMRQQALKALGLQLISQSAFTSRREHISGTWLCTARLVHADAMVTWDCVKSCLNSQRVNISQHHALYCKSNTYRCHGCL